MLCYDKDKKCSKEDIDDIEDILDEFNTEEEKKKKRDLEPKHEMHQKLLHKVITLFETLNTEEDSAMLQELMVDLYTNLKKKSSRDHIVKLLIKGIHKAGEISLKVQHKYQATHEIDINGDISPSNEEEYFNDLMSMVFTPLCPFVELAIMLHMKKDINDEYYKVVHANKSFILTIVENYYNPGNDYDNDEAVKRSIGTESARNHKFLLKSFMDPNVKELHDRVIDSLYEEFKVHNKEECYPWIYLTQPIDSVLDELLDTSHELYKYFTALDDVNNQIPMHHTIDLLSALLENDEQTNTKGLWPTYLHQLKNFVKSQHTIQQKHFEKVINSYKHKSSEKQSEIISMESQLSLIHI